MSRSSLIGAFFFTLASTTLAVSACTGDDPVVAPGGTSSGSNNGPNGTLTCPAGENACGGRCTAPTDLGACGPSCTPCSAPANGEATCDGTACGVKCKEGFTACGLACLQLDSDSENCGHCGRTCDGKTCGGGKCEPKKVTDLVPDPIAIAAGNAGNLYLRTRDRVDANLYFVSRLAKEGGALSPLANDNLAGWALKGTALAVAGDEVFFTGMSAGALERLWRQPSLASSQPKEAVAVSCGTNGCLGAAADKAGFMWFTETKVSSCALANCGNAPAEVTALQVFDAALGPANVFITASFSGGGAVKSCPRGAACPAPTDFVDAAHSAQPRWIRVHKDVVYWVDNNTGDEALKARVLACPTTGCTGAPKVILSGQYELDDLAVDDAGAYVTHGGRAYGEPDGELKVCRDLVNGCGVNLETIADKQPWISKIALDDKFVYWMNRGVDDGAGRAVYRTGK